MHPGMMWWWKRARQHGCGPDSAQAGEGGWQAGPWGHHGGGDDFGGGGAFGVRRPLRFLAYKLNLNEEQVAQLAKILDELKTERAQSAVDDRRTVVKALGKIHALLDQAQRAQLAYLIRTGVLSI
jgi:hypothetical protein